MTFFLRLVVWLLLASASHLDGEKTGPVEDEPIDQLLLWNFTSLQILSRAQEFILTALMVHDRIAAVSNPSLELVLEAYGDYVSERLRQASSEATELITKTIIALSMRKDVNDAFVRLDAAIWNGNIIGVGLELQQYLESIIDTYDRQVDGLDLHESNRVAELEVDLNRLSAQFTRNIIEDDSFLLVDPLELDGVPDEYTNMLEVIDGKIKLTSRSSVADVIMEMATSGETRRKVFELANNRCPENEFILKKILQKRRQIANIHGYQTFADYTLPNYLAGSESVVLDFLDEIKACVKEFDENEVVVLKHVKDEHLRAQNMPPQDEFFIWDCEYYQLQLLEQYLHLDQSRVAEYFPLEATIPRMLAIFENLLDIEFSEVSDATAEHKWHEDVLVYRVFKDVMRGSQKRVFMGTMYLDLYSREGKLNQASTFPILMGHIRQDGTRKPSSTALILHLEKPLNNGTFFLFHSQLVTFLHELGHVVHYILSETRYADTHSSNMQSEFSEMPSQMFENWAWSKDSLKRLSSHFDTGQPLDDDTFDKIVLSRAATLASRYLRQLLIAYFDLAVHTISSEHEIEALNMSAVANALRDEFMILSSADIPWGLYKTLSHIVDGYECSYYSYMYSGVFAADVHHTLFRNGSTYAENGAKFHDMILKRGNSRNVLDNMQELLGRRSNAIAFFDNISG